MLVKHAVLQVSLLASGRLMYHGDPAGMIPWFQSIGYTYTKGEGPLLQPAAVSCIAFDAEHLCRGAHSGMFAQMWAIDLCVWQSFCIPLLFSRCLGKEI